MAKTTKDEIKLYFPFLEEIRKRLLFTISVFIIASVIGFFYFEKLVYLLLKIVRLPGINIVFTSPFQFINLSISSALVLGLVVCFPLILIQILSFLRPALTKKEFRAITYLLPISGLLFAGGFAFGFFIMKYVITLFYQKSQELNIGNVLDVSKLLSQILLTSALMGVASQYPVVITLLLKFKVIKYQTLTSQRPFIYTAALVFAALLPPTDILSLILLTLPLVFLFEITLLLNRLILKTHLN